MRRLTVALGDEAALERVASSARPLGLRPGAASYELFRDTYFDTRGRDLAERGQSLRVRLSADGRRTLEWVRVTGVSLQGVVEEERLARPLESDGLYAALRAGGPIAERVGAVADPEALRPFMALDVDRETRDLRATLLGRRHHRVHFDHVEAHGKGMDRRFFQVSILETAPGRVSLEELGERLSGAVGVVVHRAAQDVFADLVGRTEAAPPGVPDAKAGSRVVVVSGANLAVRPGPGGYRLPSSPRTGEAGAGAFAGTVLAGQGADIPEVDLLGFAPAPGRPDVEVWLAEGTRAGDGDPAIRWIPLGEVLEGLGGPGFRDPDLVEGLLLFVRSEAGRRIVSNGGRPGVVGRPTGGLPAPGPVERDPSVPPGRDPQDFLDADLSILDFNLRVLELAEDATVPLLERFRFLSIFARNLDEFFMVRIGRLKTRADRGMAADDAALPAGLLLDVVAVRVRALLARQDRCLRDLLGELAGQGVHVRRWHEIGPEARAALTGRFRTEVFPAVTPRVMTGSAGQPFPRIEGLGVSLAAVVTTPGEEAPEVALVPLPPDLPRFLPVPGGRDVMALEEIVAALAEAFFPGASEVEAFPFRISRLGDVALDADGSESLLAMVADEVEDRAYNPVVRLEVDRSMPREVRARLLRELRAEARPGGALLGRGDTYEVDGLLDLGSLQEFTALDVPDGLYPPFRPARRPAGDESMFTVLARGDLLLHHPYDSFDDSVGRLLLEAARDPDVVSVRMTLYRVGRDALVVRALLEALRHGKDVSVFVEVQARFDEERNIEWTHRLQRAGGHVVFGVPGYKTHAKTALIVRREGDGRLVRYCHVGTGNYNAGTARLYTDVGLLSADETLGAELNDFFNELTGSSGPPSKEHSVLWVAPHRLADALLAAIRSEIEHARAGRPAGIRAKMNGLSDRAVIRALYEASAAGVDVDLVVRAICTLRPGVPGLSERIRVRSILGRFLEHARICRFENGGAPRFHIGSADWRKRNLRRRVEVAVAVTDPEARARLNGILDVELSDPGAWILGPDGRYRRAEAAGPTAQDRFMMESDGHRGTPSAPS